MGNKFHMSQMAHRKLEKKALKRGDYTVANYHKDVYTEQDRTNKVIPRKQRERMYQDADFYLRHSRSARGHDKYYG